MKRVHVIALTLIAILLVAVVFAPVPGDTRWIRTLHNSAHAPIFGCVSLLVLLVSRSQPRLQALGWLGQYALALAAALALGMLTELLQIPAGRDASFEDALHDTIGALAFLGIFAAIDTRISSVPQNMPIRFAAAIVGLVSLGVAAAPVTRAAIKSRRCGYGCSTVRIRACISSSRCPIGAVTRRWPWISPIRRR
jgi:VanZ family protein